MPKVQKVQKIQTWFTLATLARAVGNASACFAEATAETLLARRGE